MHRNVLGCLAALATLAAPPGAHAYAEFIHEVLPSRAFASRPDFLSQPLKPAGEQALTEFRHFVYEAASRLSDVNLRRGFIHRYPTEASFDSFAFKELLMLDPAKEVLGVDRTGLERTVGEALAKGSRYPDDDRRNRDRFMRDLNRQVITDPWRQPVPYDPAILWMGNASGTSSQAHAHYQTLPPPLSDDADVLKTDPRHFAIPPELMTFGADFGQVYTDLALLAALWGGEGSEYLARLYQGAWMHHAGDVCNQIHTVQVGLFDFFVDAKLESIQEELFSLGGLLRERSTFTKIGIQILTNHHLLSEGLFAKRVQEALAGGQPPAEIAAALESPQAGDAALAEDLSVRLAGNPFELQFGRVIVNRIVEPSSMEASEVYKLTRDYAKPFLSWAGAETYEDTEDPDQFVNDDAEAQEAMKKFYVLVGRGFARAGTAFRAWEEQFQRARALVPPEPPAAEPKAEPAAAPAPEAPEWTAALTTPAEAEAREKAAEAAAIEAAKPKPPPLTGIAARGPEARQAIDRVTARLVGQLLAYHREAQERRDAWEPEPPAGAAPINWWVPAGLGVVVAVIGGTVFLLSR